VHERTVSIQRFLGDGTGDTLEFAVRDSAFVACGAIVREIGQTGCNAARVTEGSTSIALLLNARGRRRPGPQCGRVADALLRPDLGLEVGKKRRSPGAGVRFGHSPRAPPARQALR
jgi:hypothetical protein